VGSLKRLHEQKERYVIRFVTNTTKESVSQLHSRLLRCGFDYISKDDIFSSLSAAKRFVAARNLRPMYFLEPGALEDFQDIPTAEPNAVVVGLAPSGFHFSRLNEAFKLLLNEHTELIAIHKGKYYRRGDGLSLGPGAFVECLEFATGKKAVVVGKPETNFFREALEACRRNEQDTINPADAVMIGDDVHDDVVGAINFGIKGCLVRTGKFREGDELKIPEATRHCVQDFASAVELILKGEL